MTTSIEFQVDPVEFRRLRQELFGFDRELLGKLNSRMKRAVEPAKAAAEAEMAGIASLGANRNGRRVESPLARKYRNGRQGVQVKVGGRASRSGNDAVVRLVGRNGAAAMLEFADNATTDAGRELVKMAQRKFGSTGRFMWDAMDRHEDKVLAEIRDEVAKTAQEFSQRLSEGVSGGVLR